MSQEKVLFLIDGSAYVHRAFHAIRNLSNSKGMPTNATFGFTRMLMKLIDQYAPEYLAMLFDAKGKNFRHEMYDDYKANRPPMPDEMAMQLPYIKSIVEGLRIPMIEVEGYEADDLIGTLAKQGEAAGFRVVMVTGDKDFMQLLSDAVSLYDPMKDEATDIAAFRKKRGIEPARMVDVMGLWGDTSDNVPGVPGIGEKTALALIQEHGSLEKIYENIDAITKKKQKENLLAYKDQAFLSRDLVAINTEAPVTFDPERFRRQPFDTEKLSEIFSELEFRRFQDMLSDGDAPKKAEADYRAIFDMEALDALIERLKSADIFALDTETTSQDPMKARLVGLSFAVKENEAFYIPCGHTYIGAPEQLPTSEVLERLKPVLEEPARRKVGQNIKYDWKVLERAGLNLQGVAFDTMIASYLIDPGKNAHNLDQIAADLFGHQTIKYQDVAGKGKAMVTFDQVLVESATPYACEDADITLRAYEALKPRLDSIGLTTLMDEVEVPLIPVLKNMEMRGVCVDREKLRDLSKNFALQLEQLESEIHSLAGEEFNINSSQQLGRILFEKLNLPVQKKTKKKTGYSTDVEVLTTLAPLHDLPALILRHRSIAKLKSTYADALLELIHPETGRIHSSFNQTVAATGRLSSSDPNLQNIPIRTEEGMEIRQALVPQEGWTMLAADYSQIELRLLAHYADDEILLRSFQEDEDIHTRTASEVFQVPVENVSAELRRQAKTINFGIIYGMGAFSLARELNISRQMAQTYIDHYFGRYKGVKRFIDETIAAAKDSRQTSTLLGRIRLLPEINSKNPNLRGFAERTAVNTPIQGTAADFIKLAMIRVDAALRDKGYKSGMLLSVHDELVFEAPDDEIDALKEMTRSIMESVWPQLRVPLKVNLGTGKNWAEAH